MTKAKRPQAPIGATARLLPQKHKVRGERVGVLFFLTVSLLGVLHLGVYI